MSGFQATAVSDSVMILVIALLRLTAGKRLPRALFPALWCAAAFRLLLPVRLPSALSVWNLTAGESRAARTAAQISEHLTPFPSLTAAPAAQEAAARLSLSGLIWAAGALLLWVTVRLYIRRPSERTESRARQGFAVGLFKLIATFAGGLGFGTIFYMITGNGDSDGAHLVWIAVFCLLVYFLVEAVLGRGFKGMARRSVVIGLGMAGLTALYAGIIFAGGMGFEGRVPAAEKVTAVTVNYRGRYEYVP